MEISAGIQASLAGRYATALYELAAGQSKTTEVESDLGKLDQALNESEDLRVLISNPEISRGDAAKAILAVAKDMKLDGLSENFLGVLAANRRLNALPDIVAAYTHIASAQRGERKAELVSAHPLSDSQLIQLQERLSAREGAKVIIEPSVDPDLLGGLVVTIGSQRIDGSIRTRLNSLAQAIKA